MVCSISFQIHHLTFVSLQEQTHFLNGDVRGRILQASLNMVASQVAEAQRRTQRQVELSLSHTYNTRYEMLLAGLHEQGVTEEQIIAATQHESINETNDNSRAASKKDRLPLPLEAAPKSKKRKVTRSGTKEVVGRKGFAALDGPHKLDFMLDAYDEATGEYVDGCRSFLFRINPFVVCYNTYCGKSREIFFTKYGNQKGNFVISQERARKMSMFKKIIVREVVKVYINWAQLNVYWSQNNIM